MADLKEPFVVDIKVTQASSIKFNQEGVDVFGPPARELLTTKTPKKVSVDEEDNEVRHTEGGYDTAKVLPRYEGFCTDSMVDIR